MPTAVYDHSVRRTGTDTRCEYCAEVFYRLKSSNRRFCTKSCGYAARKGKPLAATHRARISAAHPKQSDSPFWKGEHVSYSTLHQWIRKYFGRATTCVRCGNTRGAKRCEWANISRTYKRVLADWMQLCVICHKEYDYKPRAKSVACRRGHIYAETGAYILRNGNPSCKVCQTMRSKAYYSRLRADLPERA